MRNLVLALWLLAQALAAQDATSGPPPGPRPELPPPPRPVVSTPAINQPWVGDDGGPAAVFPAAAGAPTVAAPKPLPDSMCRLDGSTRPAVFGPGEQGKLFLIAALQDLVVLRSSGDVELGYDSDQSGIHLGRWLLPPPPASSRAPGFPDLPVYAETAILEVPITVADDAATGLHEITLHCAVELFDGDAGRSLGRFQRDLSFGIAVRGRADEPAPATGSRLLPIAEAQPPLQPTAEPSSPPPAAEGGDPLSWLLAGGAVLVLLVALLTALHRRR